MDKNFNLIQALQDDWDALSESPRYRAALGRWQQSEPALDGFHSPAEVVRWCRSHPDPKEANPPVGALLRVAADPVAARTLLQVILPGLSVRVGRAARMEARNGAGTAATCPTPTRPSPRRWAWAMGGVVALQWAMLQAVVLGLDYLRAIRVSLTKDGD